jgi:hypothetical protein
VRRLRLRHAVGFAARIQSFLFLALGTALWPMMAAILLSGCEASGRSTPNQMHLLQAWWNRNF